MFTIEILAFLIRILELEDLKENYNYWIASSVHAFVDNCFRIFWHWHEINLTKLGEKSNTQGCTYQHTCKQIIDVSLLPVMVTLRWNQELLTSGINESL